MYEAHWFLLLPSRSCLPSTAHIYTNRKLWVYVATFNSNPPEDPLPLFPQGRKRFLWHRGRSFVLDFDWFSCLKLVFRYRPASLPRPPRNTDGFLRSVQTVLCFPCLPSLGSVPVQDHGNLIPLLHGFLVEVFNPSLKALKLRMTLLPHVCPEALLNSALAPLLFQLSNPNSDTCVLPLVLLRKLRLSSFGWEVRVREDTVFVQAITRGSSSADSVWPHPSMTRFSAGHWCSASLAYRSCHCINFLSLCPQPAVTLALVWCPLFWCPGASFCELLLGSLL